MTVEELKALGNEIFRYADDPWREKFFRFIAENPGATFHNCVMKSGAGILSNEAEELLAPRIVCVTKDFVSERLEFFDGHRSEERRVGKQCRSRWTASP